MTIEIKLGNYHKEVAEPTDLATCLEFSLVWGDVSEDPAGLIRMCAGAIGVALDKEAMLPKYRPDKTSILSYGRKVLERLLEKNVPLQDIYDSGSNILVLMTKKIPTQKEVEEKKDFFHSAEGED